MTGDNLKSVTDRKGQVTTFNEYDSAGRVKKITYHDGSFTTYTYDLAGRVDYINDSVSGFIDYTYNDFGCTTCGGRGMDRIAQEVSPLGTIDYTYDAVGRRKTMTVLGQPVVNYDYYDNGWIENVRQIINGIEQKFNFLYDNGGRRERLKAFNGVSLVTETIYGFDNASRLLTLDHLNPLNQPLESLTYTYDANGNRTTMNRPSVTLPLPNPASNTSYNQANQMLSFNDKNITYDNNGNMSSVTNACGTTNYTWDVRNRLTAINGFNTDCSMLSASFKYDAIGRRIEKTINSTTTKYLYDGMDIIQEIQTGVPSANYIRTLNIDEPLARITQSAVRFYMTDALGSVIALTDENGVVKTTYSYDPFGNVSISGEASDNPFQYTGRENDGTGLYYYRARYYSPELQRFISEDPIGLAGGINLYSYVGNNPVNKKDPLGLDDLSDLEPQGQLVWPSGFKYSGYWCGPGWTGGQWGSYTPGHVYRAPRNGLDNACMNHDMCYYECREKFPCDSNNRQECMTNCNKILADEAVAAGHKYSSPLWWWMKHAPALREPNNCSCK